jgi:hypothetical protein
MGRDGIGSRMSLLDAIQASGALTASQLFCNVLAERHGLYGRVLWRLSSRGIEIDRGASGTHGLTGIFEGRMFHGRDKVILFWPSRIEIRYAAQSRVRRHRPNLWVCHDGHSPILLFGLSCDA